jgi:ornithine decarboxylase
MSTTVTPDRGPAPPPGAAESVDDLDMRKPYIRSETDPARGIAQQEDRRKPGSPMEAVQRRGTGGPSARYGTVREMIEALRPSYPVYCVHPERLAAAAQRFVAGFPGQVLYAVKCNPHPMVLDALYVGGIRDFDTASLTEIAAVAERYPDALAYFQHPVKSRAAIDNAYRVYHVRDFALDHAAELDKLGQVLTEPEACTAYVRLATPPGHAAYDLSSKFGAKPDEAVALLRRAAAMGFQPAVSFHVGSQCASPEAYAGAMALAGDVIRQSGVAVTALDVGGGFPAPYPNRTPPPLADYFYAITEGARAAGIGTDIELMCEPGRSLVADGVTVVAQILLRKDDRLYVHDGIYGSFSELMFAHFTYPARLIRGNGEPSDELVPLDLFGPTCDSEDRWRAPVQLPADAREGDWIEFGLMGAYTNALRTGFNGFFPETFVSVDETAVP